MLMLGLLLIVLFTGALAAADDEVITPRETIRLFNGKNLDNFYTWLVDSKREDPRGVFTVVDQVDGAPAIRVSGQFWGGFVTRRRYANYRLIVEFRWGLLSWGDRKDKARDSGILLHAQGPDGNTRPDFNGPWMHSVEFQIIEGGVGDIILVAGSAAGGTLRRPLLTVTARKDRDGENVFDPNGTPAQFQSGRINWWGRDVDWNGKLGFRGKEDVEKPAGEWNRLEAVCEDDKLTYFVNGKLVNAGRNSSLQSGHIMLQSEGAEIFFRRIDLEPLKN